MLEYESLNLNLLLAFEALLEEQNVTRAAKRIGLSQPAMSNALSRLREAVGDPLFRRTSRGMKATARALELAVPVRAGLSQLRTAFSAPPRFDPAAAHTFRIAMTDYAEFVLLGPLMQRIARAAPLVQIVVRRLDRIFAAPEVELRTGVFDMAIGFFPEASALDPRTRSLDLFAEENVCIASRRHRAAVPKRLTLRDFASAGQIGVFYRDDTVGLIDNILAGHGLRRRLLATTPHFLSVPFAVSASDLIAVVPAGLAAHFRKSLGLQIRKLPILLPPFHMRLLWHEHSSDDPAQKWLRAEIAKCPPPAAP